MRLGEQCVPPRERIKTTAPILIPTTKEDAMPDFQSIANAVISGKNVDAARLTQEALDAGATAQEVLTKGLVAGMDVVGKKFKCNEFYIPEVLVAARAMKAGMQLLKPLLAQSDEYAKTDRVVVGTVLGDLHDIGKNLVLMMLEGAGFQVVDLGVDCSPEKFVKAVQENNASLVGLSALLTTTMPAMKDTIAGLKEAGLLKKTKTLIGGAPVTQEFANEIGADGYAPDAATAVDKAKELLGTGAKAKKPAKAAKPKKAAKAKKS
jgi:5-methyltetrahydrofolate--homocysteine methyltransferase